VGYTGHVNDVESGLVYMQARYYDPEVGRFLSVDPVGPEPGSAFSFARYSYANNDPIRNFDPFGRSCESAEGPCDPDKEPSRPAVSPEVQRMRDTSDCGGCVRANLVTYREASVQNQTPTESIATRASELGAVGSPILGVPAGRALFKQTATRKLLRYLDDKASQMLVKRLSMGTLSISARGLLTATPYSFAVTELILHFEGLGGCDSKGVCADEVRVDRPTAPQ